MVFMEYMGTKCTMRHDPYDHPVHGLSLYCIEGGAQIVSLPSLPTTMKVDKSRRIFISGGRTGGGGAGDKLQTYDQSLNGAVVDAYYK